MQKIIAALKQLDTGNDNHWTTDGLPRLETVKFNAGDQSLTRDQVSQAAPGYTRSNPVLPEQDDASSNNGAGTNEPDSTNGAATGPAGAEEGTDQGGSAGAQDKGDSGAPSNPHAETIVNGAPPVTDTGEFVIGAGVNADGEVTSTTDHTKFSPAPEPEQPEVEADDKFDDDEASSLEASLAEAQEEVDSIILYRDKINDELGRANERRDRLQIQVDKLRKERPAAVVTQNYFASQDAALEQRAQNRKEFAQSGVKLAELAKAIGKSPIDQAMTRKTGRGGNRPTRA